MNRIVKKPEERRQEIVSAARELFLKKDFAKTTMQDVMKKLGIAKGTIYHYFKSKDALLDAVVQEMVDEYIAQLQEVLATSQGNALDRMRALLTAGNVAEEQEETLEQLHRPGNVGMHSLLLAVTISRLAPLFASLMEQGCKERLFEVEYPLESAEFLLAGVQFMTDVGCYPWSEEELTRRAAAVPSLLEVQLRATKGSFDFLLEGGS